MANINGTAGDDSITGTNVSDLIDGLGGDDAISGRIGNDRLIGNTGADHLNGGDGDDTLFSAGYSETTGPVVVLDTGTDIDTLLGAGGDDTIFAGYGDNADGGAHGDRGDRLFISFLGGSSGATVDFRLASQVVGGGTIAGFERISWVQGTNFADNINVETAARNGYSDLTRVYGMGGNDHLTAGYYTRLLSGGDGNDVLEGGDSQYLSEVNGDAGDDTLYPGTGFVRSDGGAGNDTIYSYGNAFGGEGNDIILLQGEERTDGGADGGPGDDQVTATPGGSWIIGGPGKDVLTGDADSDTIFSDDNAGRGQPAVDDNGASKDEIRAGGGNDTITAGYNDFVDGGAGTDSLRLSLAGASSGVSVNAAALLGATPFQLGGTTVQNVEVLTSLRGSEHSDTLTLSTQAKQIKVYGGAGNDVITAASSSVDADGGAGDDRFVSGNAADNFNGAAGSDTVDYRNSASGVTVILARTADGTGSGPNGDTLTSVENVNGSAGADSVSGNAFANVFQGMAGSDSLSGGGGNDRLDGGEGADTLEGGDGDDVFIVDDALDQAREATGGGRDSVEASADFALGENEAIEILATTDRTGTSAIALTGNGRDNSVFGNAGANLLKGGAGNDILDGGAGSDRLEGGTGDDLFVIDSSGDVIVELEEEGTDTARSPVSYTLSDYVENLILTGGGAVDAAGSAQANILTGNDAANRLDGRGGADTMAGGKGHDFYVVDNEADRVVENGSSGNDSVLTSVDFTLPIHLEKLVLGGTNAIDGRGNAGANTITGNARGNLINGGSGDDSIDAGAGDDLIYGHTGNDSLKGGTGLDRFLFNTALGSGNVDRILDFYAPNDTINLASTVFTEAGRNGALSSAAFRVGAAASDSSDRIVYDQASGRIYYDPDGTGAAPQILFATLSPGTAVGAADFVVYG